MTASTMFAVLSKREIHARLRKSFLVLKAYLRRESFYCRALAGESNYNICINSDLTVSCNCQDYSGQGHLGDLRTETLAQIFNGSTARRFRAMLAHRRFPTDQCPTCPERCTTPVKCADRHCTTFRVPSRGIMVENTALCNLRCPMCKREQLLATRSSNSLSLRDVEKVAAVLKENGIESVYYFNLGEPFLPADIHDQVKTIRAANPEIRIITSTNGLLLGTDEKLAAAMEMDYIFISLDGVDREMVNRYQVGSDFDRVYENMTRLAALKKEAGRLRDGVRLPIIEWRYILFRWNDRPAHLRKAVELARSAAVDLLVFAPGAARFVDRSYRSRYHPYFRRLGQRGPNGETVINFSKIPDHLISP